MLLMKTISDNQERRIQLLSFAEKDNSIVGTYYPLQQRTVPDLAALRAALRKEIFLLALQVIIVAGAVGIGCHFSWKTLKALLVRA
jgi:hypothetical protein